MPRWVGPLLLGLAACASCGCMSVGPGARQSLTLRMPWDKSVRNAVIAKSDEPSETVTFRAPHRDSMPSESVPFSGHASNLPNPPIRDSQFQQAGHQSEPAAIDWEKESPEQSNGVTDAGFRSDRDGSDHPIQLQGITTLEEPPSQVWQPEGHPGLLPHEPTPTVSASTWKSDLERLIARTEREVGAMTPGTDPALQAEYRRRQIQLRLLHLIAQHPEHALIAIPTLEPAEQEYWQKMIQAMADSLDANGDLTPQERAAEAISRLNAALRMLREQAELSIRNAAFCEEISYFGNYKRFPKEEFVPGQPVLLYAEIENFCSEPVSGEFRTLLKSQIEIIGTNYRWKKNFAATEDLCRNPRRDYFHNYQFTIPERIPLGPHTLRLTVMDELSGKQSTTMIKFMVK